MDRAKDSGADIRMYDVILRFEADDTNVFLLSCALERFEAPLEKHKFFVGASKNLQKHSFFHIFRTQGAQEGPNGEGLQKSICFWT